MPRFAANLSLMFTEHEFLDRFEAAANAGFKAVEFLFPYEFEMSEIAARLKANGLTQALFNAPPGDWENGERGISALPGREHEFHDSIGKALDYANALGCERLHVMAGIPTESMMASARATYLSNLRLAARQAANAGVTIVIEPLNTRDNPGYLITHQSDGVDVIRDVDEPNIGLQFDFYHCQIMEGDLAMNVEKFMPWIRHIQIAGVPERHEPTIGEINFPYLFDRIDALGYDGWIGCEYRPSTTTTDGLGWMTSA